MAIAVAVALEVAVAVAVRHDTSALPVGKCIALPPLQSQLEFKNTTAGSGLNDLNDLNDLKAESHSSHSAL